MNFIYPFIYTSQRDLIHEESGFDNQQGISSQETGGEHAIWAARVPFLPAMMSDDFTRLGVKRINFIQQRQFRFIYDLVRARENRATFELRFISTPNPIEGQPNLIDMIFLGKVFSKRQHGAQPLAEKLYEKFISNFPIEDPFGYPLEPVVREEEFKQYYEALPFDEFLAENLIEIRKYEDMPIRSTAPMGRVERKGDYIAHPFVPSEDFNPMGRFFVALASQPQKCFAGISIRPTRMWDQEIYNVSFMIGQFAKTATEDDDITEEYIRTRSKIGIYVYKKMMMAREQLVTVRVYLAGEHEIPVGLSEALGSELMGNADNAYPTMWVTATPADAKEREAVVHNLKFLEQDMWGHTIASAPLARLRYLATPEEAYGAFRLPVPPESGYMPGVLVRNEPFVAPADELELREQARANLNDAQSISKSQSAQKKISLGVVYHRGKATAGEFRINIRDLTRHALIAGSTGSGKSTTIKHVLYQLWAQHQIPFLVLYPLDKPDYRELLGFPEFKNDLTVFTLGDARTSPFQFNPFEVPDGLLIKTHLSRLMRVFMAAFSLQDPLPMIYRDALRQVYRMKGWDILTGVGETDREYPIMSEFYQAIKDITEGLQYGKEVKDNVRQASVIRIADLLENAGHVVNVRHSMNLGVILNTPTIMEIGRVGSTQDTSLLMGFLLMRFAEEVERHPRKPDNPHITVVEEAHRLMAESAATGMSGDSRSAAGEDFSNILAEVRGYGEGIIIAEQIPTLLVKGAIGNTYIKIMHWLEDTHSFDVFSSIMNLSQTQREYARSLTPGFAVVRNPYGRPVHVKIPEFGDQPGFLKSANPPSDDEIQHLMAERRAKLGLAVVHPDEFQTSLSAASETTDKHEISPAILSWMLGIPMQTCVFCKPLLSEKKCAYGQRVRNRLLGDLAFSGQAEPHLRVLLDPKTSVDDKGMAVLQIVQLAAEKMKGLAPEQMAQIAYCYMAHRVDQFVREKRLPEDAAARNNARALLQNFDHMYRSAGK